jgi:hypothetical protein
MKVVSFGEEIARTYARTPKNCPMFRVSEERRQGRSCYFGETITGTRSKTTKEEIIMGSSPGENDFSTSKTSQIKQKHHNRTLFISSGRIKEQRP